MEKSLFQDKEPQERVRMLKDNADKVEELGYQKPLSDEEINKLKEQLTELSIEIEDVTFAKELDMRSYKDKLKGLEEQRTEVIRPLSDKTKFVNEICYKFVDAEAGKVGYYNEDGQLVYERGILPEERQKTIFEIMEVRKTGTEN